MAPDIGVVTERGIAPLGRFGYLRHGSFPGMELGQSIEPGAVARGRAFSFQAAFGRDANSASKLSRVMSVRRPALRASS